MKVVVNLGLRAMSPSNVLGGLVFVVIEPVTVPDKDRRVLRRKDLGPGGSSGRG